MRLLCLFVAAGLVFAVASFGFQNARYVALDYFGAQLASVPLWLVVAVPAAAGVLIGSLLAVPGQVRGVFARRHAAKQGSARDRTSDALRLRVVELERDLALARLAAPAPPAITEEGPRPPDVPDASRGETTRSQREAAAA